VANCNKSAAYLVTSVKTI